MIRFQQNARPRTDTPSHRFAVGQTVRMKSRIGMLQKPVELFEIKSRLPVKDGSPQYRIRSEQETHERVTSQFQIERVAGPQPFDLKLTIFSDPRGPHVYYGMRAETDSDGHALEERLAKLGE